VRVLLAWPHVRPALREPLHVEPATYVYQDHERRNRPTTASAHSALGRLHVPPRSHAHLPCPSRGATGCFVRSCSSYYSAVLVQLLGHGAPRYRYTADEQVDLRSPYTFECVPSGIPD
jgi:hypothetical protein